MSIHFCSSFFCIYHHCPQFIQVVLKYVSSLPSDMNIMLVYNVVLDVVETPEFHWIYSFIEEARQLEAEDHLSTSNCAICLQELQAGSTKAAIVMPCSHVSFHHGFFKMIIIAPCAASARHCNRSFSLVDLCQLIGLDLMVEYIEKIDIILKLVWGLQCKSLIHAKLYVVGHI